MSPEKPGQHRPLAGTSPSMAACAQSARGWAGIARVSQPCCRNPGDACMTSFDRQNAHFNDSRLYRQSAELSTGLLASNLNNDPLRELCHIALHGVSGLTINEPRQFERTIRNLHAHLVRLARGSSAYQFIPAIHEAVGEFYRTDKAGDLQWVGGALKLAAGSLWTEMMASRSVGARSEQALTDLVVAAGALIRHSSRRFIYT